jgi:GNAT superfamily N-acetyltransferase
MLADIATAGGVPFVDAASQAAQGNYGQAAISGLLDAPPVKMAGMALAPLAGVISNIKPFQKINIPSGYIDEKIGNSTISYRMNDDGFLEIASIRTPQSKRGQGSASNLMAELTKKADEVGIPMILGASPLDKKTQLNRLVEFYKKYGFEPTGKKINLVGEPEMVRYPKKY